MFYRRDPEVDAAARVHPPLLGNAPASGAHPFYYDALCLPDRIKACPFSISRFDIPVLRYILYSVLSKRETIHVTVFFGSSSLIVVIIAPTMSSVLFPDVDVCCCCCCCCLTRDVNKATAHSHLHNPRGYPLHPTRISPHLVTRDDALHIGDHSGWQWSLLDIWKTPMERGKIQCDSAEMMHFCRRRAVCPHCETSIRWHSGAATSQCRLLDGLAMCQCFVLGGEGIEGLSLF